MCVFSCIMSITWCHPPDALRAKLVNLDAPLLSRSFEASGISALAFSVLLLAPGEIVFDDVEIMGSISTAEPCEDRIKLIEALVGTWKVGFLIRVLFSYPQHLFDTQPNRPRASPAIFKHVGQVPYSRGFKFGEKGPIKILAHFFLQVRRCWISSKF